MKIVQNTIVFLTPKLIKKEFVNENSSYEIISKHIKSRTGQK